MRRVGGGKDSALTRGDLSAYRLSRELAQRCATELGGVSRGHSTRFAGKGRTWNEVSKWQVRGKRKDSRKPLIGAPHRKKWWIHRVLWERRALTRHKPGATPAGPSGTVVFHEPPYTERYVRWCERTGVNHPLLLGAALGGFS